MRVKNTVKSKTNRILILITILGTGLVSLFFWYRGEENSLNKSISISPSPKNTIIPELSQKPKVLEAVNKLVATASGEYAVYVWRPDEKYGYGINENDVMPVASIMKLPVFLVAIDKIKNGDLRFEDTYTLEEADRSIGSGPLQFKTAGTNYSIEVLLNYLGKNSDNTAWVMFNRRWGYAIFQNKLDSLGLKAFDYKDLEATAYETSLLMEGIYKNYPQITKYLVDSIYEDRIPAGITDPNLEIIHKVGTDVGVWSDTAIIQCTGNRSQCTANPIILTILNKEVSREEASWIVPEIARLIWNYENNR